MPIAQYFTFKCKKCGYKFVKRRGDVITTLPKCPKCGGEVEIINVKPYKSPFDDVVILFENIFKKSD